MNNPGECIYLVNDNERESFLVVLVPESCDKGGRINYPDDFVSDDGKFLNFAFDDNRHR